MPLGAVQNNAVVFHIYIIHTYTYRILSRSHVISCQRVDCVGLSTSPSPDYWTRLPTDPSSARTARVISPGARFRIKTTRKHPFSAHVGPMTKNVTCIFVMVLIHVDTCHPCQSDRNLFWACFLLRCLTNDFIWWCIMRNGESACWSCQPDHSREHAYTDLWKLRVTEWLVITRAEPKNLSMPLGGTTEAFEENRRKGKLKGLEKSLVPAVFKDICKRSHDKSRFGNHPELAKPSRPDAPVRRRTQTAISCF